MLECYFQLKFIEQIIVSHLFCLKSMTLLVNNTKKCADADNTVRDIIVEEANMYFNDKKSLEETVKIIQNRVQTYVDENQ